MTRKRLSPKQRAALFAAHKGRCHLCGERIEATEGWQADHVHALALGGRDDVSNLAPAHVNCHRRKTSGTKATTAGSDIHAIAKVKRILKGKTPKRKIPSKPFDKTWRRKMDGTVERRAA